MARSGVSWGLDPAVVGKSIDGLGDMFGPPKATDIYAYAKAAKERQDIARSTDAFALLSGDKDVGPTGAAIIAATGQGSSLGDLSKRQLFTAASAPGATAADIDTRSYAIHGNYGQTKAGNAQQQDADIKKALGVQDLQNAGNLAVERAKPVQTAEGATTQFGPAEAGIRGLPQQSIGVVKTAEGSSATLPDGRVIYGPEKASDGTKGIKNYRLPDGTQGTAYFDPVTRKGIDTQTGKEILPGFITFEGLPSAGTGPKTQNWTSADGKRGGRVIIDAAGRTVNEADGQPLPPDAKLQADVSGSPEKDKGNDAYDAERGKNFATMAADIDAQATKAQTKIAIADRLTDLQRQISSGALEPARLRIKQMLASMGVPSDGLDAEQSFLKLTGELAAENVGVYGSNPSNGDREAIAALKPQLSDTAGTIKYALDKTRREAEQTVAIQRLARTYEMEHGRLDVGFMKLVDDYRVAHPLYEREIRANPASSAKLDAEIAARQSGGASAPAGSPAGTPPGNADGSTAAPTPATETAPPAVPAGYGAPRRAPDGMWYTQDGAGKYHRVTP